MRRGVVEKVEDNSTKGQKVKVHGVAGELRTGVEHAQPYGLTTIPEPIEEDGKGAECIILDMFGATNPVVICVADRRYRPRKGATGDVILYSSGDNPDAGHLNATCRLVLTKDQRLIARIGGAKFDMSADSISFKLGGAELTLSGGNVTLKGGSITLDSSSVNLSP